MKLVITISRRYGTGASQIAGELSEQLGIPVYDKTHVEEKMCSNSYDSEAAVIKELAMKPCIILGRCASGSYRADYEEGEYIRRRGCEEAGYNGCRAF